MLKVFDKKLSVLENGLVLFVGVSIFIVMILTSIQIISRVLGYPWPAFLELSELAISIFAFLGVAYAQKMDTHIRMELLVSNLTGRIRWVVEFLSTLLSFFVISILIYFSSLFTITNMPIKRFAQFLHLEGELTNYKRLLIENYNSNNLNNVMCRELISIDWEGRIYDCDFNQQLRINSEIQPKNLIDLDKKFYNFYGEKISVGDHCYGCTAGCGSSCGGSLD